MTTHSDKDLLIAAQAAYADLDVGMDILKREGKDPTLENILAITPPSDSPEKYDPLRELASDPSRAADWERVKDWEVVTVYNSNKTTGFYGCAIKTSEDDVIVSFRGSEELNTEQLKLDWIDADARLLNSTLTTQQGEVERFLGELSEMPEMQGIDSIAFSGHSLGGNLAEHAAIASALYGFFRGKVTQCANYDGPGHSDEYIERYGPQIEEMAGIMTDYQWSMVGNMLLPLPGVRSEDLAVKDNPDMLYGIIGKHATDSILFDESGQAIRGDQGFLEALIGYSTRGIDHMPSAFGDALVSAIASFADCLHSMQGVMLDEDGNLTPAGWGITIGFIAAVMMVPPPALLVGGATAAILLFGGIVITAAGEFIREKLVAFAEQAADMLVKVGTWARHTAVWVAGQVKGAAVRVGAWTVGTAMRVGKQVRERALQVKGQVEDAFAWAKQQVVGAAVRVGRWTAGTIGLSWALAEQIKNRVAQKLNGFIQWLAAGGGTQPLSRGVAASRVRDFSQARKAELLHLIGEVRGEWPLDVSGWDAWCQAEQAARAVLPGLLGGLSPVRDYHRKVVDTNNMSIARIESVFLQAYDLDRRYAARLQAQVAGAMRLRGALERLAASVGPAA